MYVCIYVCNVLNCIVMSFNVVCVCMFVCNVMQCMYVCMYVSSVPLDPTGNAEDALCDDFHQDDDDDER